MLREKILGEMQRGEVSSALADHVPLASEDEVAPFQANLEARDEEPGRRRTRTSYHADYARIAEAMCRLGGTDADICQALGVSYATLWSWQAEHEDFFRAMVLGKDLPNKRVERALYLRAVGYSHPAVKIMQYEGRAFVVPYVEHFAPDANAALKWLERRDPENWAAAQEVKLSTDESFANMWRMISEGQILPTLNQENADAGEDPGENQG